MRRGLLIGVVCVYALAAAYLVYARTPIFRPGILGGFNAPEFSGWIAWWEEDKAYALLGTYGSYFHSVSPYWYDIDEQFSLHDATSTVDKTAIVRRLDAQGVEVVPLVGTDLRLAALSPLFAPAHAGAVAGQIATMAHQLGVPQVDVDIEEVDVADRDSYIRFLQTVRDALHAQGVRMTVSVIAQTGDAELDGSGSQGVDLARVGAVADQVNLLAYDLNGGGTPAGPITTVSWLSQVIAYAQARVPKEKLVLGLPNYGYLWEGSSTEPEAFAYDEFMDAFGSDRRYSVVRDENSGELHYTAPGLDAWLADSISLALYIKTAEAAGVRRFSVWQIGGMDERLFR